MPRHPKRPTQDRRGRLREHQPVEHIPGDAAPGLWSSRSAHLRQGE